jgi:predicted DNA-binding antitoxin AbrB/MazE fold protein
MISAFPCPRYQGIVIVVPRRREEGLNVGQKVKAIYHNGVLELLEPLHFSEDEHVVVTVEPEASGSSLDILGLAGLVYKGLDAQDIKDVESIALDRRRFFRDPSL